MLIYWLLVIITYKALYLLTGNCTLISCAGDSIVQY